MNRDNNIIISGSMPYEKVFIALSGKGFIKRVPAAVYRAQHSRGKGCRGMAVREADAAKFMVAAATHDSLLFFTNIGKVYHLKCNEIPVDASRTVKGLAIVNLFSFAEKERITSLISVTGFKPEHFLLLATEKGEIQKSSLEFYDSVRRSGIIAIDLEVGDELISTVVATNDDEVVLITEQGQSIRFKVNTLPSSSPTSGGVRGIRLEEGDKLVSMSVVIPNSYLLVVTVNAYGKLTAAENYKTQTLGSVGIKTLTVTDKTGKVAAARLASETQQLMLVSNNGIVLTTPVQDEDGGGIPILGRGAQGVILMRMDEGDRISAIAVWE